MTKAKTLARLGQITQLALDLKLADLRAAAKSRQHSLDMLASLNTVVDAPGLSLVAAHQVDMRYQHWADVRRAEINITLAQQTVALHAARETASLAFGKDQALRGLRAKLR